MSYAYITPEGQIDAVVVKPSALRPLFPGWRLLPYNLPQVDMELNTVTPIVPVPAEANEVTFSVVPLPDASSRLLGRLVRLIDAEVDELYRTVIGARGPEYELAEKQAREWNGLEPVPDYVRVWAEATDMTNTEAAQDIISQANAWRAAALAIREHRLKAKEMVRAGNVEGGMLYWRSFMSGIRQQLGV